jgi:hypothetical protein
LAVEPNFGKFPIAFDRGHRDAQGRCRLLLGQTAKEAQLDDLAGSGLQAFKVSQSFIQRSQVRRNGMTPEQWQRVREVYEAVAEETPERRVAALAELCDGDVELRAQVERLLGLSHQARTFLESSPFVEANWWQAISSAESAVGRRLGPYQLIREIGVGGMSTVYLAVRADDEYKKEVAIKLVWPGLKSAEVVRRFKQERQIFVLPCNTRIATSSSIAI